MASIKRNGYYNDPAIGQAFANLASAFGPPKATDVYAYAKARQTNEAAARLSDFYKVANDPNATQDQIDRAAVAAQAYLPTQSWRKVNMDDQTTRYGVDVGARTKLQQAGIDNAAASERNAADNARALQQTELNNSGEMARSMAKPVIVGEGQTAFLPQQTQAATGLPQFFRGGVNMKPGDVFVPPSQLDEAPIAGAPKPRTEAEVKGAILAGLPAEDQRNSALASVKPNIVQGPDGTAQIIMGQRADGMRPAATPVAPNPSAFNYQEGNQIGLATQGPDGKVRDVATGRELGPGASRREITGSAEETKIGAGTQSQVDQQVLQIGQANAAVDNLLKLVDENPSSQGIVGAIRGTTQDLFQTGTALSKLLQSDAMANAQAAAEGKIDPALAGQLFNFDGSIPAITMAENLVIGHMVRLQNGGDQRMSNEMFNRMKASVGSGWLGNPEKTRAVLGAFKRDMATRLDGYRALVSDPRIIPTINMPAAPAPPPAATRATPPAGGGSIVDVTTPEEAMKLAPGTTFRTPDGKLKVRP